MMKVNLNGMLHESLVNGKGLRMVFFLQGCKHNCEGCHNPSTHPMDGGEQFDMDEIRYIIERNKLVRGITFSGGEPFLQPQALLEMCKICKENNKDIWIYTGYTYEYLLEHYKEILNYIDVLVDGKFEINNTKDVSRFKGSNNQRIIDVQQSLEYKSIVYQVYVNSELLTKWR